ncbi:DUF2202 domain-containing protein [Hydrogenovibrio sp. 3SP14C1]|uniref:DUF2202 domain-containing protein n=1 Tax=Hydrogenovibrio sp. 3SP14C1 TaxID=3038774 RepID=UPI00241713D7|nr:DUF2202 domain-containing protein [Hydrogenovibrio sp. 3SP14C1]MDG4811766.1 DUF2202 domain-containing protein [Hydrogenovibrio sp. 3SP14C1]
MKNVLLTLLLSGFLTTFASQASATDTSIIGQISADEESGLLYMREEEKLARDVYLTLYERWEVNIFQNIADSETKHTETIKSLLETYALADPVLDDSVGIFTDYHFTELYVALTEAGSTSYEDALRVGIQIEELDIRDIAEKISKVEDNPDIVEVYENLMKGSRNHLRSFWKLFQETGLEYEPQYISEEEFNEIVNSPME